MNFLALGMVLQLDFDYCKSVPEKRVSLALKTTRMAIKIFPRTCFVRNIALLTLILICISQLAVNSFHRTIKVTQLFPAQITFYSLCLISTELIEEELTADNLSILWNYQQTKPSLFNLELIEKQVNAQWSLRKHSIPWIALET